MVTKKKKKEIKEKIQQRHMDDYFTCADVLVAALAMLVDQLVEVVGCTTVDPRCCMSSCVGS